MMNSLKFKFLWAASFALFVAPSAVLGGGTRIWELAGFDELDKGEPDGTRVSSLGEVGLGRNAKKLDLKDVGLVWSAVRDSTGSIYLGTGYDGKISRVRQNKVEEVASTDQLVVTSLAIDKKGNLFVATLPDAVVWRIENPGKIAGAKPVKAVKWAELPKGTEHVWTLAFSRDGRTLYAGTGPEGKIFAIGADAKADVYLDTDEEHVLALAISDKGEVFAGTSPGAMLLKVSGPGRSTVLEDFDATELKAIALRGDDIFAAVNTFKKPPAVPTKKDSESEAAKSGSSSTKDKKSREAGDGELYRFSAAGRAEQIWAQKKTHVVSLAIARNGLLFAGLGAEGKIISIDRDRVLRTEIDLDERQVMALVASDDLIFAATGDAGSVYSVSIARPGDAVYLTPPLDAESISSWGRLSWFARGKLNVQSRSGNSKTPDETWSDWSKPLGQGSLIASPAARYLQLRFSWAKDEDAVLVSTEVFYHGENLRAVITEFDPDSPFPKPKKSTKDTGEIAVSTRTIEAKPDKKNEAELTLTWKVDNPDEDSLRYQLWYRAVGEKVWRPITKDDEVLQATRYTWKTESVPEGRYQIRLLADDSPDNDVRDALSDEYVSVPILVDNHQPEVKKLSFGKRLVSGAAKDGFSWTPIFSKDGVYDEKEEDFDFALPKELKPGPHAVAVRAYDRAGNMGAQEIHIDLK
jgi:hypothetical protein